MRDLKAGLDRGGPTRTWDEVAAIVGVSTAYARRVAEGKLAAKPPVVWIDPREIVAQLSDRLDDEAVLAWNEDPRCLCGCGQECLQETGHHAKVPYGAYRLYRGAHEKRMPWIKIVVKDRNREIQRCRALGMARRAENVNAAIIAGLLNEWKIRSGRGGFTSLARIAGLSPSHLRDIASGRNQRMHKLTAAKILIALGEPLRPEIFAEYKAWCQANGIAWGLAQAMVEQ